VVQERLKGLVQLSAGTTFQDFQQQLAQRIGLLPGQLQVVIACSRANEFDQLQKIPIHEGTVSHLVSSPCATMVLADPDRHVRLSLPH
jgi:hypothetical protein